MPDSFKTIGVIGKRTDPLVEIPLKTLATHLASNGYSVLIDIDSTQTFGLSQYEPLTLNEIARRADLVIVMGGDGTLLNIACTLAPEEVPLLGINLGRLGFLTDVSIDSMLTTVQSILEGEYVTEYRMLLQGQIALDRQKEIQLAMNDIVITRGEQSNMVELAVSIDGQFAFETRGDGLILSTPTGSTAYALASGGPILHPKLEMISLVPICPHTLSQRPLVIDGQSCIEIELTSRNNATIHFDSHGYFFFEQGQHLFVQRYPEPIQLLHPKGHDYYRTLREKLRWSETLGERKA